MQYKDFFTVVFLGFFILVSVGCNPDSRFVKVEGTVTYNGAAIEGAQVAFQPVPPDGVQASGDTDATGKFTLTSVGAESGGTGALPGEYIVRIWKEQVTNTPDPDEELQKQGKITYEELQRRMATKGPNAGTKVERVDLLPKKYKGHDSPLKVTVNKGSRTHNFELSDN